MNSLTLRCCGITFERATNICSADLRIALKSADPSAGLMGVLLTGVLALAEAGDEIPDNLKARLFILTAPKVPKVGDMMDKIGADPQLRYGPQGALLDALAQNGQDALVADVIDTFVDIVARPGLQARAALGVVGQLGATNAMDFAHATHGCLFEQNPNKGDPLAKCVAEHPNPEAAVAWRDLRGALDNPDVNEADGSKV